MVDEFKDIRSCKLNLHWTNTQSEIHPLSPSLVCPCQDEIVDEIRLQRPTKYIYATKVSYWDWHSSWCCTKITLTGFPCLNKMFLFSKAFEIFHIPGLPRGEITCNFCRIGPCKVRICNANFHPATFVLGCRDCSCRMLPITLVYYFRSGRGS